MHLRVRIVDAYAQGEGTYQELAQRFNVGEATVRRYVARQEERGSVEPDPHGGGTVAKIGPDDLQALCELVAESSDDRIEDLARKWSKNRKKLSYAAMQRGLKRFGITRKKRRS
jgi:transposase